MEVSLDFFFARDTRTEYNSKEDKRDFFFDAAYKEFKHHSQLANK